MHLPKARKGMPSPQLEEAAFRARYLEQFIDPCVRSLARGAGSGRGGGRGGVFDHSKSPVTEKAGAGFADPDYDLSVDWIAAKAAMDADKAQYEDESGPCRFLLTN